LYSEYELVDLSIGKDLPSPASRNTQQGNSTHDFLDYFKLSEMRCEKVGSGKGVKHILDTELFWTGITDQYHPVIASARDSNLRP